MRTNVLIAALLALLAPRGVADAQLLTSKDGPVVFGHYHLHVTNPDAHRKFWVDTLGGRTVKVGPLEAVAYPNVFVFLQPGKPQGARGTTVDHIAFRVVDLKATLEKVRAAGYAITTKADVNAMYPQAGDIAEVADRGMSVAFVVGPDDAKVELIQPSKSPRAPAAPVGSISFDHVHLTVPDVIAARDWYVKTFGAKIGSQNFESRFLDLPAMPGALQISRSPGQQAPTGTRTHVVDHIGFEVKGLEAFLKQAEGSGTKLDMPFRRVEAAGLNIAFLTDSWGTYIELTEGLNAIP